jgi:A/G-specific adenine glycosylase
MLQQTQVDTVIPYFERWMRRFPSLAALAAADEDQVLAAWQGLGYYSRARSLLRCARTLVELGQAELPRSDTELRRLPGIGRYTAGAIASIAFGQDVPVVDGNVVRVLTRYFALRGDPRKEPLVSGLWRLAERLLVAGRAGDFNQALMELGALVCRPRAPACAACPLRSDCGARRAGDPEAFPELAARPRPTRVRAVAAVVRQQGRLLLVRTGADASRWAGLWTLPHVDAAQGEDGARAAERAVREHTGLSVRARGQLGTLEHSITRYRYTLEWHEMTAPRGHARAAMGARVGFHEPEILPELALPAPHRAICDSLGA